MSVGGLCELLNVQHRQGGVGDGLAEYRLGVGPEGGLQLLIGAVWGDEGDFNAHLGHGDGDQVEGASIDGGRGDDVVPAGADVEQGEEVGRLAGGGEHGGGAALQLTDLGGHVVVGGVLEAGVEIAAGLQVKELAHVLGGCVLEGGGLDDGDLTGFPIAGGVASLDTFRFDAVIAHGVLLLSMR